MQEVPSSNLGGPTSLLKDLQPVPLSGGLLSGPNSTPGRRVDACSMTPTASRCGDSTWGHGNDGEVFSLLLISRIRRRKITLPYMDDSARLRSVAGWGQGTDGSSMTPRGTRRTDWTWGCGADGGILGRVFVSRIRRRKTSVPYEEIRRPRFCAAFLAWSPSAMVCAALDLR